MIERTPDRFSPWPETLVADTGSSTELIYTDDKAITIELDVKDRFESYKVRSRVFGCESDWSDWFAG